MIELGVLSLGKSHVQVKADLHYGHYCSKLVHFEAQKNIFYVQKSPSFEGLLP
jgi:hypothetical protein